MPFGKFKGQDLRHVPDHYLDWLFFDIALREPLRSAVYREISKRDGLNYAPAATDTGHIKRVYRELALKWHPDKGGSTEAMQAVNEFYEAIKQV
jgi:hypothetical protein